MTASITLVGCLGLQCVGLLIFVLASSEEVYIIGCAVYGLGFGGVGALLPLVSIDTFGLEHFGEVYGRQGFFNLGPVIVGPLLAGWIYDNTGSYKLCFMVTIAVFVVSAICLLIARKYILLRTVTPTQNIGETHDKIPD